MLFESKFMRFLAGTLLILAIIFIGSQVSFIFHPINVAFQTLFIPFLIAGVFFYILRPFVKYLHTYKVPKALSIVIIYLIFIGVIVSIFLLIGPVLQEQVMNLADNAPALFNDLNNLLVEIDQNEWFQDFVATDDFSIENLTENLTDYLSEAFDFIADNVAGFFGAVTNFLLVLIVVPFMLFFMLKDGEKLPDQVFRFLPEKQQEEGQRILFDMDDKLSSYIQGQIIVSIFVGTLMYIAYLIIGVDFSLILALVNMVTNVVPFVGPWIGSIPAVIVGVIDSPMTAVWIIVAIIIVQQLESNLISPNVMGKKLSVHPLMIIVLILVGGSFGGLLALILAVPFYAVVKVIVTHVYRLFQLRKKIDEELNQ
ncbi:AI-2E family transporter [Salisediminibacterium halotolerans]|uniref:AI-2E family transporter n=2 Tax=Salisediminibacterium halotolerans TaxID=517425 RepID=UPI000F28C8FE|nr:putative PurR-regulated permease PerM [Actinophytocola xinjiangensis]RPE87436.1 putative PurR-regulated permease PerM [Salisediminibacterium halotolerans]TWG35307.1 putative PurR-regulated permease PerM [Salisediminibacterium halotolerans]GEL07938.1 UPF0118 membrane protein YueF [Salisediminibacterium halotolerans]